MHLLSWQMDAIAVLLVVSESVTNANERTNPLLMLHLHRAG
ncbi:hypothetical protein [Streptomyces sp. NPDC058664]